MAAEKTSENLYQRLVVLMIRAKRHLAVVCDKYQMTPVQGILLTILEPDKPKSMNELSEILGCDASNTTGLIERLEAHGLVEDVNCVRDRRVRMIQLSKKGKGCRKDILTNLRRAEATDLSKLSDSESSTFAKLIDKIA